MDTASTFAGIAQSVSLLALTSADFKLKPDNTDPIYCGEWRIVRSEYWRLWRQRQKPYIWKIWIWALINAPPNAWGDWPTLRNWAKFTYLSNASHPPDVPNAQALELLGIAKPEPSEWQFSSDGIWPLMWWMADTRHYIEQNYRQWNAEAIEAHENQPWLGSAKLADLHAGFWWGTRSKPFYNSNFQQATLLCEGADPYVSATGEKARLVLDPALWFHKLYLGFFPIIFVGPGVKYRYAVTFWKQGEPLHRREFTWQRKEDDTFGPDLTAIQGGRNGGMWDARPQEDVVFAMDSDLVPVMRTYHLSPITIQAPADAATLELLTSLHWNTITWNPENWHIYFAVHSADCPF